MGYVPFVLPACAFCGAGNKKPQAAIATRGWVKKSQPQARESRLRLNRSSNRLPIRRELQDMRVTGYELLVRGSEVDFASAIFTHTVEAQGALHGKAVHGCLLAALEPRVIHEVHVISD
jgi:hypothetical protein